MTEQGKPTVIGVPRETYPGERRVALVPGVIPGLKKAGIEVMMESGAGDEAGMTQNSFADKGAKVGVSRDEIFSSADVIFQVRTLGTNPEAGRADLDRMRKGQIVVGMTESLTKPELAKEQAERGITLFSLELLPRITRAQSMDVLSSMATIAGYKAVLLAANTLPRLFPMFMTAAGTIAPARVFVIGAGVAGLQAIASAKRMGAVVSGYDIRPVVKEQVQSLGAKFVEIEIDAGESQDKGGYAKEMDEAFYRKQRELMTRVVADHDVVITTAAIPGKKAPILITEEMIKGMAPGSVIVDIAAESGGNCEGTRAGETVDIHGVKLIGPANIPSTIPFHASQMYAKNITTFFSNMFKEGAIQMNLEDEIIRDTLVAKDGEVFSPRVRELLGLSNTEVTEGRQA